ncbi:MAG: 50S ribosomal protein L9 [Ignavibacteria bacterium]|jgi:large subunit ribosomal protein L9|nr:50S ribosomal protein L9 [Ignavibacteria bacterium]MDH7528833.1 50S ribosomal protein L9 [Ignavibacteria bacterium]
MKVILRQDYEPLGKIGDVVEVKDGYARNFLIPKKIVYPATPGSLKAVEEERKRLQAKLQREKKSAELLAVELEKVSVTIPVEVGEEDRIHGTVTTQMIADALLEKGYEIDKRKIELDEQIKTLGIYTAKIKLHPEVIAQIKVWVVKE